MALELPLWIDPDPANPDPAAAPKFSARQDRGILDALFSEGVQGVGSGELRVRQRAAGANMTVEVDPGVGYIGGDDIARQGMYRLVLTAVEPRVIAAAPATGARTDLVVLRVHDAAAKGGALHGAFLDVITGTGTGTPATPATAIALARIAVSAGAAGITNSMITDLRTQAGAATLRVGTAAIAGTTAYRDSLPNPDPGLLVFNTSTDHLQRYGASGWRDVEGYTTTQVFTSSTTWTRPAGLRAVLVTVIDGGGRGDTSGTPGAGGALAERWIDAAALPPTVVITVAGESGLSSFGTHLSTSFYAPGATPRRGGSGGNGGGQSDTPAPGGRGAAGTAGTGGAGGSGGQPGTNATQGEPTQAGNGAPGGDSSEPRATGGGGGGGGGRVDTRGSGNPPPNGGAGGRGGIPGGGGGGGAQGAMGGIGARGQVVVDMYF